MPTSHLADIPSKKPFHRTERLETRLTPDQKDLFKRAAAIQGRTLNDFIIHSLQEAAIHTVQEHEILTLGSRDRETFVKALLETPKPGSRLRNAYRRYRNRMDK